MERNPESQTVIAYVRLDSCNVLEVNLPLQFEATWKMRKSKVDKNIHFYSSTGHGKKTD